MPDPTIHDLYVALGGDADDDDPTIQDLYEAAVVLGDAADPATAIGAHEAAVNPHPTYETSAEAQAKVDAAVAALVNAAPSALNTLKELSDALAADPNFATTMTTALGNKQTLAANLTAFAALSLVADRLPYANGTGTLALATLTSFARSILDDADAATVRATLGLGTAATAASGDFATASHGHAGSDVTSGTVAIARLPASLQAIPHGSGAPSGAPSGVGFYFDDVGAKGYAYVDGAWVPFGVSGGGGSDYIATVAAEANLLRYWPINEPLGSSSFHEELGGAALTGTVSCGQCILNGDVNGGAAGMSNPLHRLLNAAPFAWPAAWTMECWAFFLMNFAAGPIFAQWDGLGAAVYSLGAGSVRAYSGGSYATWAGSTNADLTGRHHVLLGHDGTNIKLFWDGVERASSAIAKPTGSQGSNPILGGWNGGGSGGPFVLSDFAVYSNFDAGRAAAHYALATQ